MELTVVNTGGDRHRISIGCHELIVDQPRAAGGEDAGPTPTDLFVASLASCVAHFAHRGLGADAEAAHVHCSWTMSETQPWRVATIDIDVDLPPGTSEARQAAVERAIGHCTVHNSLITPPRVSITSRVAAMHDRAISAGARRGVRPPSDAVETRR